MNAVKQKTRQEVIEAADRLHSAAIHLLRLVRQQDAASGQGPARLSALSVLVFAGPMTLGRLASAELVKPPTMTRIVTGLERRKLAERVSDPDDARRIQIRATAKGTRLLQAARKRRIEYLAQRLDMLNRDQVQALNNAALILEKAFRTGRPEKA